MNSKKLLSGLIASTIVFSFIGGCSTNEKTSIENSSETDDTNTETLEDRVERENEEQKKIAIKYINKLKKDANNKYDVAIKYMKEQFNIKTIAYKNSDSQNLSSDNFDELITVTLKLAEDENVIFDVYISPSSEIISTNLYSSYVAYYANEALSKEASSLLPKGSEIIADFNLNGEKSIDSMDFKNKSLSDLLSNEDIYISNLCLAIKTPDKVDDYNLYKESILNTLSLTKNNHKGGSKLYVKIMFTTEDNYATKYCDVFGKKPLDLLGLWHNPIMDIQSPLNKTKKQNDLHSKINAFARLELSYEPDEMVSGLNSLDLNSSISYNKYK